MSTTAPTRHSTAIDVDAGHYYAAHGRRPRGTGSWGFCPRDAYDRADYLDHVFWFTGSYGDAKARAIAHFKRGAPRGITITIVVCE